MAHWEVVYAVRDKTNGNVLSYHSDKAEALEDIESSPNYFVEEVVIVEYS